MVFEENILVFLTNIAKGRKLLEKIHLAEYWNRCHQQTEVATSAAIATIIKSLIDDKVLAFTDIFQAQSH